MIPRSREAKIEWIRTHVIPLFDSQLDSIRARELNSDRVERSERILAEAYLDESNGVWKMFLKVSIPLLVIDTVTLMPAQVYGLVFSITGTALILVEADILGSESITARSRKTVGGVYDGRTYLDEEKAMRLARNTVVTNIGLVWLVIGFVLQILGVWLFGSETLVEPIVRIAELSPL